MHAKHADVCTLGSHSHPQQVNAHNRAACLTIAHVAYSATRTQQQQQSFLQQSMSFRLTAGSYRLHEKQSAALNGTTLRISVRSGAA